MTDFISALQAISFTTLISQNEIKDFTDNVDDGVRYTLEITIGNHIMSFNITAVSRFQIRIYDGPINQDGVINFP